MRKLLVQTEFAVTEAEAFYGMQNQKVKPFAHALARRSIKMGLRGFCGASWLANVANPE
jgi:hypothetical protein